MYCDCHIHMALDGSDWKAALARHKTAPDEAFIRATLKNYQALGFVFRADAGHEYGTIEKKGFRKLVVEQDGKPVIVPNPKWEK